MAEEQAAHHLLNVLEERGLDAGQDLDDILATFLNDDTKTQAAEWVNEYLHQETLLTKEELRLYQTLQRKGLARQYETGDAALRPILDHELESAIASLQQSTRAIEQQCKMLEAQKAALLQLRASNKPSAEVGHARAEAKRKQDQERAKLDVAVEDISLELKEQLEDAQRDIDAEKAAIEGYLKERFSSDDQILDRLPGIVVQMTKETRASKDEESADQWCQAIISFESAEIKARVDAIYMESLHDEVPGGLRHINTEELQQRKVALKTELDDMRSEVEEIAAMVVEYELRGPLRKNKDSHQEQAAETRTAWLVYILGTLEYMSSRLETVGGYIESASQLGQALVYVSRAAATHSASDTVSKRNSRGVHAAGPAAGGFVAPVRLQPSVKLDLPPAFRDALRHINAPIAFTDAQDLATSLNSLQLESCNKLQDNLDSSALTVHDKLATRLAAGDRDAGIISRALHVHTFFRELRLADPELAKRTGEITARLERADAELLEEQASALSLGGARVRAFVAKFTQ